MSLMDAPVYDPTRDNRINALLKAAGILFLVLVVLAFAGFVAGHGWLFTNLPAEHRVDNFYKALEAKDYPKAYGIYQNDANWQQHPEKYAADYPLKKFTEDWTTYSPVNAPITSHHVDKSVSDGSGAFGTGLIVAVRVNGNNKVFMYVNRKDGTMTWPAPHVFEYH